MDRLGALFGLALVFAMIAVAFVLVPVVVGRTLADSIEAACWITAIASVVVGVIWHVVTYRDRS
jgi:multisubunit Na+/H+ antiporter MnhF subunit